MSTARRIGAAATIAFPVTIVVADFFRIRGETGSVGNGDTVDSVRSQLAAIAANTGSFTLAAWLFYAAALLTIPMVVFLWRVTVDRTPRWAWAAAVLGALAVVGQVAHCMGYFAPHLAHSAGDHGAGAEAILTLSTTGYSLAVFAPYLIGVMLFPPVAVVALRRARVTPLWAMMAAIVGSIAFAVFAGPWWVTALWSAGLLAGFVPAARLGFASGAVDRSDVSRPQTVPSLP